MLRRKVLIALLFSLLPVAVLAGGIPAGPNVQVTDAGLGQYDDAADPELAIHGSALYAAWLDTRDGSTTRRPIYFARSDDGGVSWSANRRVSLLSYVGFSERPVISVAPDGSIWVAWWLGRCASIEVGECGGVDRTNDTRLALSTDGGQTWGEYAAYDGNNNTDDIDGYPEIHAANDRTLLLTYNPTGAGADVVIRSIARTGPGTLQATTVPVSQGSGNGRITENIIPDGPVVSMAVRGSTVCAAWEDRRGTFAIYGACSVNGGTSFGPNVQISGANDVNPRLAFGPDGTLYAAYQDVENGPIVLRRSGDNGASWDAPNQAFGLASGLDLVSYDLDVDPGGQLLLTVPLSSGSGIGSASDLHLATSIDRGQSFALSAPLEDGQGTYPTVSTQIHPRTVVGAGPLGARAITVWGDDRNTQDQIWSTRVDLDSTAPSAPANLRAQGGDGSIVLSWDAATDANNVAGYHVLRASAAGGPFSQITPRPVTATGYRDVGLDGTTYVYRVYAVDGTGNPGPLSNTASAAAAVGSGLGSLSGTIAYKAGNDLALRSFGGGGLGQPRVLSQANAPVFSHDGRQLLSIVTTGGNSSVLSQNLDGSGTRTVYTGGTQLTDLDTAADANFLGTVALQPYGGATFCQAFEPRLVSLQPPQTVSNVGATIAPDMSVSSDRSLLAYSYKAWCNGVASGVYDSTRLCVKNTLTGQERCLDGADADASDFVPQRSTLVFTAVFSGQRELWRAEVGADGGLSTFVQLTRGPAGQPASAPSISTDGSWVVFTRDTDAGAGENLVLHAVRLDGDGLRSLGVSGDDPVWAGGGPAPAPAPGARRTLLPLAQR